MKNNFLKVLALVTLLAIAFTLLPASALTSNQYAMTASYRSLFKEYDIAVPGFGQKSLAASSLTGDVNNDGSVTASDALLVLRHALNVITLSASQLASADCDGDGSVTTADALVIMRYCLGVPMPTPGATDTPAPTATPTAEPTATPSPNTFEVRFVDYNGSVIETKQVQRGGSVTPPPDPTRAQYIFAGWNGTYINVTSDQTVTATYISASSSNVLKVSNATTSNNGTVTVTLALMGQVNMCGYDLILTFDSDLLTVSSIVDGSGVSSNQTGNRILISYLNASCVNETNSRTIITVTFTTNANESVATPVSVIVDSMFNADDEDVPYTIVNGVVNVII